MLSSLWAFRKRSQSRYKKVTSITPNMNTVHAIAISNNGQVLACGGVDGTKLWNLQSYREIPSNSQNACGAVSCITWIATKRSAIETLCYGTGLGYIVFLRPNPVDKRYQEICTRRLGSGLEITCVAWGASTVDAGSRIAVGMRDNAIHVFLLDPNSQLQSIFAGRLESTVPKSIVFADHGYVYIFGLFDGNVVKMNISDGEIFSEYQCETVIGCATLCPQKRLVVIDNVTNGFTLYRLDIMNQGPIRTYITDPPKIRVPKQVAFGEGYKVVIGGSDNGSVYVFERKSGQLLETLRHTKDGLVQSISVRDVGTGCLIASVSPAVDRRKAVINIWAYEYDKHEPTVDRVHGQRNSCSVIRVVLALLAVVSMMVGCWYTCPRALQMDALPEWATLPLRQISQRCLKLAVVPDTEPPVPVTYSASAAPKVVQGNRNDIELLRELAGRIMDLTWEPDSSVARHVDGVPARDVEGALAVGDAINNEKAVKRRNRNIIYL